MLILVANWKVHMGFRLASRSMTLDDFELLFLTVGGFRGIWHYTRHGTDGCCSLR